MNQLTCKKCVIIRSGSQGTFNHSNDKQQITKTLFIITLFIKLKHDDDASPENHTHSSTMFYSFLQSLQDITSFCQKCARLFIGLYIHPHSILALSVSLMTFFQLHHKLQSNNFMLQKFFSRAISLWIDNQTLFAVTSAGANLCKTCCRFKQTLQNTTFQSKWE